MSLEWLSSCQGLRRVRNELWEHSDFFDEKRALHSGVSLVSPSRPWAAPDCETQALPSFQMQFCPGTLLHTVCPKVGLGQPELTLMNLFPEQYLSLRSGGLGGSALWPPEKVPSLKFPRGSETLQWALCTGEYARSVSTKLTQKIYFPLITKEITRTWPSEYCEEPQFPEP